MKKFLSCCLLTVFLLLPLSASAGVINSEYDAAAKVKKIQELANFNLGSLVSRGEMIGNKYENFVMVSMQYQRSAQVTGEQISGLIAQAQIIQNSEDYAESDKAAELQKLYIQMDSFLYNLDSQTFDYLISLRKVMPSVTFQKYVRKFENYYNNLNLTDKDIGIKIIKGLNDPY